MKMLTSLAAFAMSMQVAGIRKATKYIDKNLVVKVTLKSYGGKRPRKGSTVDAVLTVGRPNYAERKFIARCRKAGEKLPVRKVQFQHFK